MALPPVLAVTGLTAAPSHAGPAIGTGSLDVLVKTDGSGFVVCADGNVPSSLRVAGVWTLTITGERFNPSTGDNEFMTPMVWTSSAWQVVDHCEQVFRWGYPYGTFVADFSYTAAGEYVAVHSKGGGTWDPQLGNQPWSVNPACTDPCS